MELSDGIVMFSPLDVTMLCPLDADRGDIHHTRKVHKE